jgi:hypothetical protein
MFVPFYKIFSKLDKRFASEGYATTMPTVEAYVELHSGPIFLMHYRYAAILLQISVTLCFGSALPILYWIAVLAFSVQYVVDRILLCYFY